MRSVSILLLLVVLFVAIICLASQKATCQNVTVPTQQEVQNFINNFYALLDNHTSADAIAPLVDDEVVVILPSFSFERDEDDIDNKTLFLDAYKRWTLSRFNELRKNYQASISSTLQDGKVLVNSTDFYAASTWTPGAALSTRYSFNLTTEWELGYQTIINGNNNNNATVVLYSWIVTNQTAVPAPNVTSDCEDELRALKDKWQRNTIVAGVSAGVGAGILGLLVGALVAGAAVWYYCFLHNHHAGGDRDYRAF